MKGTGFRTLICLLLATILCGHPSSAQQIAGVLLDSESAEPVAFANIWFKGSTIGTYSSGSGYFEVALSGDTLMVSSVGYEQRVIPLSQFTSQELVDLAIALRPAPIILDPVVSTSHELKRSKSIGFVNNRSANRLVSAIWKDYFQMFRVTVPVWYGRPAYLESVNFRIERFEPDYSLVVKLMLTHGASEMPLPDKPLFVRIGPEDLPYIKIDLLQHNVAVESGTVNVDLSLVGVEMIEDGPIQKGMVEFAYASKRTSDQRTFMRRSPENSWTDSADFFRAGPLYENLNLWIDVVW